MRARRWQVRVVIKLSRTGLAADAPSSRVGPLLDHRDNPNDRFRLKRNS